MVSPFGKWSTSSACSAPKAPSMPTAYADSRTCPAEPGPRTPTGGRKVSAVCSNMSNATVTPACLGLTRSMATSSAPGSRNSVSSTLTALLSLIANSDSRRCPAGRGTPSPTCGRRVSVACGSSSNVTVTNACLPLTRSLGTGQVSAHRPPGPNTTRLRAGRPGQPTCRTRCRRWPPPGHRGAVARRSTRHRRRRGFADPGRRGGGHEP